MGTLILKHTYLYPWVVSQYLLLILGFIFHRKHVAKAV